MAEVPVPGFRKLWTQELTGLKYKYHAIRNKHPQAAYTVKQVYKVLIDIEKLTKIWTSLGQLQSSPSLFVVRC
jgi:hypothetical protein